MVNKVMNLLSEIKQSTTIDYKEEKNLVEDINKSLEDAENEELVDKTQQIDKKGFNDIYYLDKELIVLLSTIGNEEVATKIRKNFINQIYNYEESSKKLANIESNNVAINNRIMEIKKDFIGIKYNIIRFCHNS